MNSVSLFSFKHIIVMLISVAIIWLIASNFAPQINHNVLQTTQNGVSQFSGVKEIQKGINVQDWLGK